MSVYTKINDTGFQLEYFDSGTGKLYGKMLVLVAKSRAPITCKVTAQLLIYNFVFSYGGLFLCSLSIYG